MNPIPAEILKGIPLISKAKTPPIAAIGIAVNISKAFLIELKVKNSNKNINNNAAGTAINNRELASSRFSNCPPNTVK